MTHAPGSAASAGEAPRPAWREALLLLLLCAASFWFLLGKLGLMDPDEPFYAQTAREMNERGDWSTPYIFGAPQFEKPILFYWLEAGSFRLLGETEFAARVPPALAGTLLVLLVWALGRRMFPGRAGLWAGMVLATALMPMAMTRIVLTDVVFALFSTAAIAALWMAGRQPERATLWTLAHFAASALAVLVKGPLGTLVPLFTALAWWRWGSFRPPLRPRVLAAGVALYALIAAPWFALMLSRFGGEFFRAFFVHENWERLIRAEHPANNHWWYYPAVLLAGSIPWLPLLALQFLPGRPAATRAPRVFAWCWLLPNLIFLTIAQSKLSSYAFFLLAPLALLAAASIEDVLQRGYGRRRERLVVGVLAGAQAAALLAGAGFAAPLISGSTAPMLLAGALLLLFAARFSWRPAAWALAPAAAALPLAMGWMLVRSAASVEDLVSSRHATADLMRQIQPGDAIVTDKTLVRGVHYYSRLPVVVADAEAQPFWTPHPVTVVVGAGGLRRWIREHPRTWVVARKAGWNLLPSSADWEMKPSYFGAKLLVLLGPKDAAPPGGGGP